MASSEEERTAAREQSLFREVNERIEEIASAWAASTEVLCECASAACHETVVISTEEYEAVRSRPNRFLVKPGHVDSGVERVVDENDRYVVVEKVREGGKLAAELDPRRRRDDDAPDSRR